MRLVVDSVRTRAEDLSSEERDFLLGYLTFDNGAGRFSGVPTFCLFDEGLDTFPSGFALSAAKAASKAGFSVELDQSPWFDSLAPEDPGADLRWLDVLQTEAVRRSIDRGRGILWAGTGFGKTEVFVGLVRAVPGKWLYVAHRSGLAAQTADRWDRRTREHGVDESPAGRVYEGALAPSERVTCCSLSTLYAMLRRGPKAFSALVEGVVGLFVDEAHVAPAESFHAVVRNVPAARRIGASGTPLDRTDRRSSIAVGALGTVIFRVRTSKLVETGRVPKTKLTMVAVHQLPKDRLDDWKRVESTLVNRSAKRNAALTDIAKRAALPAFLFVKSLAHGRDMVKRLAKVGLRAEFVWGKLSLQARSRKVKDLVEGRLDVIVCNVVFQEGLDVPELRAVVDGAGQASVIACLQKLGRGLRVEKDAAGNVVEGGDEVEFWDVFDVGSRFLERRSKARRKAYLDEGHVVRVENEDLLALCGEDVSPKKEFEDELVERPRVSET